MKRPTFDVRKCSPDAKIQSHALWNSGKKFQTGVTEIMFGKYEEEDEEEDTLCDKKNRWLLLIAESSVGD
jgi:hypothetical protein